MDPEIIFTLLYLLLTFCVIYPPSEFVTAGFTVPAIFKKYLGSETENFIDFHIKRSLLTLLIYSLLPLGYISILYILGFEQELSTLLLGGSIFWKAFCTTSLVLPLLALYQIKIWCDNDYEKHPLAVTLSKFCNRNMNWRSVASDINVEYRRIDKLYIRTSSIVHIVATENWLLKITPIKIFVAHQSDSSLVVKEANTYNMSHLGVNECQYLNIEVKTSRNDIENFIIRINAMDFKDLEDRLGRSVTILPNVKFHKSVTEHFVDIFKDTIKANPPYETNLELDQCIGCLQARPSVKLQKVCEDSTTNNNCSSCYCRPMWCSDCMAKWFASRQDMDQQSRWLSSKCTCPLCRATFCILDVCPITQRNEE